MWAYESVFYQIYPLGFCGAPFENDGALEHRILKVLDWIPHMSRLGINAVYFSPLFESDTHGYNTRDYRKVDVRLGTNEDFKRVCDALHENGIKIVLDGVFNHVGRGFWAFQDVLKNRQSSPYINWFYRIAFDGNSNYNDGLWYEGWEGNYDLVKLNLQNEDVVRHLLDSVKFWVDEFGIDGLRLDVAYSLDEGFVRRLRSFTDGLKEDFYLLGEMLHGDYNRMVNDRMLHSATNYECYKGLYSSFNSMNMFEVNHSLMRQFGPENWTLYKGKHMLSFVALAASTSKQVKFEPAVYRIHADSHISTPIWVLFPLPLLPEPQCHPRWFQGSVWYTVPSSPSMNPWTQEPPCAGLSQERTNADALGWGQPTEWSISPFTVIFRPAA